MGCTIPSVPPIYFKNKGGWCPCFICADRSYSQRSEILFNHLSHITDLVRLIESYIPLDCPHVPLWYVYGKQKEFYQVKPQTMFGHVVWNYYATQHKGVALYAIIRGTYRDAIWVDETRLKLQILDKHFKPGRHPNCFKGFRAIMQDGPVSCSRLNTIVSHFQFWIKTIDLHIYNFSIMQLELEGFYPLVWILFVFILRSKHVPFITKKHIIRFLVKDSYFCTSIKDNWTNLAGEFLEALSVLPSLRYDSFIQTLYHAKPFCKICH